MDDILKCMPKMLSGKELDEKLAILPTYNKSIIEKSTTERLIAMQDIYQIFIPNAMSREIYIKLYLALLRSLRKKHSILAVRQSNENSKMIRREFFESIIGGSDSFSIIGPSGIGKTSAISRAINLLAEKTVLEFSNGKIISCLQIQTPADCSVKSLLLEILRKTDELLHSRYYETAIRSRSTTDMLIGCVSQVALNHIGLLIIDEIQNIVNNKNGKTLIGTLTQLINNSGVSICMVGTPESAIFFEQERMLARRTLGLNYTAMEYNNNFRDFCKEIIAYSYVQKTISMDEAMLLWLYNHSGGNASVVISLIHDSQEIAILEGYEQLDISMLNIAFEKRMGMLHNFIKPTVIKSSPVKKKISSPITITEKNILADNISIHQIAMDAKVSQSDIVSILRQNGFKIEEVVI
jgi:hypothetical protein